MAALCTAGVLVSGCTAAATPRPQETPPTENVVTAPVTRQDLATDDQLAGWLGYGEPIPLSASREGMVTKLPREGAVIRRGDVVAEIDGKATRLLYGQTPAWRRLSAGVPKGPDIKQLNDNLAALGYAKRDDLPDDLFDWRTRMAVYAWQHELNLPRTGVVEFGDVLFAPAAVRVEKVESPLGATVAPGQVLADVTGTDQLVAIDLDAALRDTVHEGLAVVVVLPDRTRTEATVASVGRTISGDPASEQEPIVKVEVELASELDELDASPVTVVVERVLAADALTVPVGALVARPGGGYAVERARAGGTELVTVEPGQFADGLVEITGGIAEGDEVVVPS
ncbi:peptidoglycan-binding protein [Phytoactinopolyspora mesophila]|uniref:peptidoglycan-binding protein n=1 Tax=Phytoactinopolyspora mesophila TaxID=2650750 RepID=UPI0013919C0A